MSSRAERNLPSDRIATLRRYNGLLGSSVLALFVCVHVASVSRVVRGPEAFASAMRSMLSILGHPVVEALLLGVPLLVHTLLSVVLLFRPRPVPQQSSARWLLLLHRVAGLSLLPFLALHLYWLRLPRLRDRDAWLQHYDRLDGLLNIPWVWAVSVLGVSAAAFHTAFGLRTVALNSERLSLQTSRVLGALAVVVGVLLWLFALDALVHFAWRCGGVLPGRSTELQQVCAGLR